MDILNDATHSSGGNSKPLSNGTLFVEGVLGKYVLLCGVRDVVMVPHVVGWTSRGLHNPTRVRDEWVDGGRSAI